jgi:hypothetical protein
MKKEIYQLLISKIKSYSSILNTLRQSLKTVLNGLNVNLLENPLLPNKPDGPYRRKLKNMCDCMKWESTLE